MNKSGSSRGVGGLLGILVIVLVTFDPMAVTANYMNKYTYQTVLDPPPHDHVAEMARYIVKVSNWTTIATISAREPTVGFPFSNIVSVSDGPSSKPTGVPYMYVTDLDVSSIDIKQDNRATLSMSLAQSGYCNTQNYDPEDPRCARILLSGRVVKIPNDSEEAKFAQVAMFSKHPAMATWPKDHGFYFAKMEISSIMVLAYFGGASSLTPADYYNVTDSDIFKMEKKFKIRQDSPKKSKKRFTKRVEYIMFEG